MQLKPCVSIDFYQVYPNLTTAPKYIDRPLNSFSSSGHPWLRNTSDVKAPLDILIFKLMKSYMRSSPLRKAALRVGTVCIPLISFMRLLNIQRYANFISAYS